MQLRVAEMRDAEAIVFVINAAFRQAESFLIDRDRIDLAEVRQLQQTGSLWSHEAIALTLACCR